MIRPPAHWSVRYFLDKARAELYARRNPEAPWYARAAVAEIAARLRPEFTGIEWGAGRSTLWYAARTAALIAVEHDGAWYDRLQRIIAARGVDNVVLLRRSESVESYTEPGRALDDGLLDYAVVDGLHRDACMTIAIDKLRPGGLLVLDDAHRYLPAETRAPLAIGPNGTPPTPLWRSVAARIADWPRIWTSDGVRDTAIWTKPGNV